jgi:sigma-B regulation protein RsbU (phosphoserine phosphatase)
MNGLDLVLNIRNMDSPNYTYVIMMTAKSEKACVAQALAAGADDFIAKPINRTELRWRLRSGLRVLHLEENLASRIQEIFEAKKRIEVVNRRMQSDLAAAAQTQRALLPSAPPSNEAATCGWFYQPSDELGGDSLNLFSFRRNKIGMYIADVSGHGVAAALLAVTIHRTLTPVPGQPSMLTMGTTENSIPLGQRPADLIDILNKRFPMDPETMQYFTLCYGCLDCDNGNFQYSVAGHPQPVLVRDGIAERLPGGGLPVGFLEDADPEEYMVSLEPGDRVCIYSDGISEAVNDDNVQFGDDELFAALAKFNDLSVQECLDSVMKSVLDWNGSTQLRDDASVILFEYAGPCGRIEDIATRSFGAAPCTPVPLH